MRAPLNPGHPLRRSRLRQKPPAIPGPYDRMLPAEHEKIRVGISMMPRGQHARSHMAQRQLVLLEKHHDFHDEGLPNARQSNKQDDKA